MTYATAGWCVGAGATAMGGRAENEDAFLAEFPVFVVSDGMGGHVGGAAASAAVIDAFRSLAGRHSLSPVEVRDAVDDAQSRVAVVSAGMGADTGATLTGVVAVEHDGAPWWMVINVGDSRVYAVIGGAIRQITVDHSQVQELVDAGRITPEQARVHPDRNVVTRAIGDGVPGCDAWLVRARLGARMIVASDGLTKELDDGEISSTATLPGSAADVAERLVGAALARGARDNVTVVVTEAMTAETPVESREAPWLAWPAPHQDEDDTTVETARRGSV